MRISLKTILLAGTIAALPGVASAEWYVGGNVGASFLEDSDVTGPRGRNLDTDFDTGYVLMGKVGYSFGMIGVEGELGWREGDASEMGGRNVKGDVGAFSTMGNVVLDLMPEGKWHPFIGAGLGVANVSADDVRRASGVGYDGGSWEFAYQGFAGVGYDVTDDITLDAQYRYFATTDYSTDARGNAGRARSTDAEFGSHNILVGLTYHFNPPPAPAPVPVAAPAPAAPPPAPAPAKAMPKNYMVFFDFDKTIITPEAAAIISQAAAAAKDGKMARVALTGHADRSGTDKYNLALSQKRADAVRAELVKLGIPMAEISVVAKGESDPLVQTPDGVREPQNRRVEIVLP